MTLLDSFLGRAAVAGLGVALAAAPLGCFVVWRRMAYFGEATAQAAILGVALAFALNISLFVGVIAVALAVALVVSNLSERGFGTDTALGVLAHSALAFGLIAVSFLDAVRVDVTAFLFGDILAVSRTDLLVIWIGALGVVGLLAWRWNALLLATLSPELACAAGINAKREKRTMTVALAVVVAVTIKVIGALLIAALLIIPAAAARPLARTPEQMVLWAAAIGATSSTFGLWIAYWVDTPAGPTIVGLSAVIFGLTTTVHALIHRRK